MNICLCASTHCVLSSVDIFMIYKSNQSGYYLTTYPTEASLSDILVSFVFENILSSMYVDWGPPHLSLVVCYTLHPLIPLPCKTWFYKDYSKNYKNLDVIRTLGRSNRTIYCNLQNICFFSLIDLDTLTIMYSIMMLVKFRTSSNQRHWIWSCDESGLCNPRPVSLETRSWLAPVMFR